MLNKIVRWFYDFSVSVLQSPATYPLGTFYLGAIFVIPSAVAGRIQPSTALIILTGMLLLLVLISFRKGLAEVHDLVNSTNTRLVRRITQLTATLVENNIPVPEEPDPEDIPESDIPESSESDDDTKGT